MNMITNHSNDADSIHCYLTSIINKNIFLLLREKNHFYWRIIINIFLYLVVIWKDCGEVSLLYFSLSLLDFFPGSISGSLISCILWVLEPNWNPAYWKANPQFLMIKLLQFRFWCKLDPTYWKNLRFLWGTLPVFRMEIRTVKIL